MIIFESRATGKRYKEANFDFRYIDLGLHGKVTYIELRDKFNLINRRFNWDEVWFVMPDGSKKELRDFEGNRDLFESAKWPAGSWKDALKV